jgi:hypothetical protein
MMLLGERWWRWLIEAPDSEGVHGMEGWQLVVVAGNGTTRRQLYSPGRRCSMMCSMEGWCSSGMRAQRLEKSMTKEVSGMVGSGAMSTQGGVLQQWAAWLR